VLIYRAAEPPEAGEAEGFRQPASAKAYRMKTALTRTLAMYSSCNINSALWGAFRNLLITLAIAGIIFSPVRSEDLTQGQIETDVELPKADADGFVKIIGGDDDLKIWRGLADYWYAKDGVVGGHQTKANSKQTFLILPVRLRDFELRLKYRFVSPEGNSGIQFRSKILDNESYRVGGYQADMDATARFDGSIYDEAGVAGGRGTLSERGDKTTWNAENERQTQKFADSDELLKAIKAGDWNDVVLIARGNHITYVINDHVMTDLVDESPNALREGVLALQLHQGFEMDVQFKDGRIRKID
jgi:hypothetical protein